MRNLQPAPLPMSAVHSHSVSIEVGVERCTNQRMKLTTLPLLEQVQSPIPSSAVEHGLALTLQMRTLHTRTSSSQLSCTLNALCASSSRFKFFIMNGLISSSANVLGSPHWECLSSGSYYDYRTARGQHAGRVGSDGNVPLEHVRSDLGAVQCSTSKIVSPLSSVID